MDVLMESNQQTDGSKRQSHLFLKGPIPLWWVETAAKECGPSSLIIGLILFFRSGLKRRPSPITRLEIEKWGLTRNTRDAALKRLTSARLINLKPFRKRFFPELDLNSRKPIESNLQIKAPNNCYTITEFKGCAAASEKENEFWGIFYAH